ncbi:hypothetical protein FRC08_009539 [Ceratobasidium sp. 394]|nr:hypothetical protein FRC08_009539 [Ceratobasidium sp. 394]
MPPQSTVQSRFEHIIKLLGLESRLIQSKLGNYFAVNSLSAILKNEMANPLVRKELIFYPQDDGKSVHQAANGQRWMEEVNALLAAPMVRKSLRFGHQDYFVDEPLLASVPHLEGGLNAAPRPFLPVRFFQRQGDLFARSHPLVPTESGYIIDGDAHVELPLSSFLLPLPEFLSEHRRYNLPSPNTILGVRSSTNLDELQPWDKPVENPWRQKAEGKLVCSMPLWLYCDDTSGNTSKKWNKHNSFLFTLTGLPRAQTQLPYNIHFLATSNIASPLEMLHELVKELSEARTNGVVAYDCELGEEVVAIPWVYAMQGDNPMQSELCSHIGMTGKFFCRVCHVRGKDKERGEEDEGEAKRVTEFMQIHDPRTVGQTISSLRQQEAIALRGTFSVIENEARKTGVKDKYFMSFISMLKERQDQHKRGRARRGAEFLQSLRQQTPEQLFNPALFIPDLDANQDTPVEILHVILLGIAKYFWRDAVARQTAEGKEILKARIDSLDLSGLGLSAPRGSTLVQYAGSLTGRDFRVILQIGVLVLYDLVPSEAYNAWRALSHLTPLAFQSEIDNIDDYVVILSDSINALLEATVLWTPQWFNKPKFHVLLHLPQHIRRFGPAVLFATETFESYNFVIRLRSVHSNRHAPSHDISRAFSRLYAVHHLVSGGWVTHTIDKSTKLPVSAIPRQAGSAVLNLRNDPEFMSLMGMSLLDPESSCGKFIAQHPSIFQPWASTRASQHITLQALAPDVEVTMCERVVLRNGDIATRNGYVMIEYQGSRVPARVVEILASRQRFLGLTAQIGTLLPSVDTYDMPGFELYDKFCFITLDDTLCCLSIFHNCARQGCTVARTKITRQERQQTSILGLEVQHCGNLSDLVLNVASLRSASLIQPLRSPPKVSASVSEVAQHAVTIWQENAAIKQAENEEKERAKKENAEKKEQQKQERERKKLERELKRAEKAAKQPAKAGGRSRRGKPK